MSGKIYIASHPAFNSLDPFDHLYLIFDPNVDGDNNPATNPNDPLNAQNDAQVLRGQPSGTLPTFGSLSVETIGSINVSEDRFSKDANGDGQPDTPSDRNLTLLNIEGQDAAVVWTAMKAYATEINTAAFDYDIVTGHDVNSNSFVTSILSKFGIDIAAAGPVIGGDNTWDNNPSNDVTTPRYAEGWFPGSSTILSGAGSDALQGFNGSDQFRDKGGGSDTFYGGDESQKIKSSNADGYDVVVYDNQGLGLGLKIDSHFADHRTVEDGEGGIDTLYSIEQVNSQHFIFSNSITYKNFDRGIELRDETQPEIQNQKDQFGIDFDTVVRIDETNGSIFTVGNFGTFTGTQYADSFELNQLLGRTFDGGGGIDRVAYVNFSDIHGLTFDQDSNGNFSVYVTGSNVTAGPPQGFANDTLTSIENIAGSTEADNFNLKGPSNIQVQGGGNVNQTASDTVDYSQNADHSGMFIDISGFIGKAYNHDAAGGQDTLIQIQSVIATNYNDTIKASVDVNNVIDGLAGVNTVDYSGDTTGINVNLDTGTVTNDAGNTNTLHHMQNVVGTANNDIIVGNAENNIISGGLGGYDQLDGGEGINTLDYSAYQGMGIRVDLELNTIMTPSFGSPLGYVDIGTIQNFQNVIGTGQNDTLIASDAGAILNGGGGDDFFTVGFGTDSIIGGQGVDSLSFYKLVDHGLTVDLAAGTYSTTDGSASGTFSGIENLYDAGTVNVIGYQPSPDNAYVYIQANLVKIDGSLAYIAEPYHSGFYTDNGLEVAGQFELHGATDIPAYYTGQNEIVWKGIVPDQWWPVDLIGVVEGFQSTGESHYWLNFSPYQKSISLNLDEPGNSGHLSIIGSNFGDTISMSNQATTVWTGKGDDFITANTGEMIYSGGQDEITMSSLGSVVLSMAPDINPSEVSFSKSLIAEYFDPAMGPAYAFYDISVNIAGHGSILLHNPNNLGFVTDRLSPIDGHSVVINPIPEIAINYLHGVETVTPYDDILTGSNINGGSGNDVITGTGGNDALHGGYGDDTINGLGGNDTLVGGTGNDYLNGGEGDDILIGGQGDDVLDGGSGNDTLYGGLGNDSLTAAHAITLNGGEGNDSYILSASYNTILNDVSGDTEITITDRSMQDVAYTITNSVLQMFTVGSTTPFLTIPDAESLLQSNYTFHFSDGMSGGLYYSATDGNDDNPQGSVGLSVTVDMKAGDDSFYGSEFNDVISGGAGDDTLAGYGGDDKIYGGIGNDVLDGGAGNDLLNGGDGSNQISYTGALSGITVNLAAGIVSNDGYGGHDTLLNIDQVTGSSFDDNITGDDQSNIIVDIGGNDTYQGGKGDDVIFDFGQGNDTYIFQAGDGNDAVLDQGGENILKIIGGETAANTTFAELNGNLIIHYDDTVSIQGFFSADPTATSFVLQYDDGTTFDLNPFMTNGLPVLNNSPIAQADDFTVSRDTAFIGNVLIDNGHGADSDPDGDTLNVVSQTVMTAAGGTAVFLSSGSLSYSPAAGFTGVDQVTYTLQDGHGGTATGTVNFNITPPLNLPPLAQNDLVSVAEDTILHGSVLADNGHGADSDPNADVITVTAQALTTAQGASVDLHSDGTFTYSPAVNFNGTDSFFYTESDPSGAQASATVSITVTPVNDAPTVGNDQFVMNEDNILMGNVLLNDSDVDHDLLSVASQSLTTANGGQLLLTTDGTFTYTPAANYNGADSFTYNVSDGHGGTATANAGITINPVNDTPIAKPDEFTGVKNTDIEGNLLINNGHGLDSDVDGDTLKIVQDMIASTSGGSVILMANGDFVYMPPSNFTGIDTFNYTVTDGNGGTAISTATLTIHPPVTINHDPIAESDSFTGKICDTITGNVLLDNGHGVDHDPDGNPLSVQADIIHTLNGGIATLNADGTFVYTPAVGFKGQDTFTYTLKDGQGGSATGVVTLEIARKQDHDGHHGHEGHGEGHHEDHNPGHGRDHDHRKDQDHDHGKDRDHDDRHNGRDRDDDHNQQGGLCDANRNGNDDNAQGHHEAHHNESHGFSYVLEHNASMNIFAFGAGHDTEAHKDISDHHHGQGPDPSDALADFDPVTHMIEQFVYSRGDGNKDNTPSKDHAQAGHHPGAIGVIESVGHHTDDLVHNGNLVV